MNDHGHSRAIPDGAAVLAVDQGTSATKAVVLDSRYRVLGRHEVAVRVVYGPGGAVETDPADLLDSVLVAGRTALERAGRAAGAVAAVALANQGETVLAWDRATGAPRSAAIGWQDRRAQSVVDGLSAADPELADRIAARTGLVLDPYFSAPKLAWLRRRIDGGVITTSDSWLIHRLCGEFVTDASTASRSLLVASDTRPGGPADWDPQLLATFGLPADDLPRVVGCDETIGTTSAFGRPLPLAGLLVDQQAALLGQGCLAIGAAKCTFGTGAFLLVHTGGAAPRSAAGLSTSIAWQLRGRTSYCLDGQVYAAGSAVSWLHRLGLITTAAELDPLCAGVPDDGSDDILCVPALAGLGAPWWRPGATATLTGLRLASGPGHVALAVLRGIAAQVAAMSDAARESTATATAGSTAASTVGGSAAAGDTLRVDGGLVACRTLMQAVADIAQLRVEVAPSAQATADGVAAAAFLALDPGAEARDVVPRHAPAQVFEPCWSADRAADHRGRWLAVLRGVHSR